MSSTFGIAPNCALINSTIHAGSHGAPFDLWVAIGGQFQACITSLYPSNVTDPSKPYVLNIGGTYYAEQVALASGMIHQLRYLHGIICAMMSKTGVVGFVTSTLSNPNLVHSIAAFAVGVRTAEAELGASSPTGRPLRILLGVSGSYNAIVPEKEATELLLEQGADCIAAQENDLSVNYAAAAANAYSLGYNSDARYFSGESVLSSALFVWTRLMEGALFRVANESWVESYLDDRTVNNLNYGFKEGGVALSGYSTVIDTPLCEQINGKIQRFINGTLDVYCEPYYNDSLIQSPNNTYQLWNGTNNVTCVTEPVWMVNMEGVPNGVELFVDYSNPSNNPYIVVFIRWSSPEAIVLIILCSGLILAALLSCIDVIWNWQSPVYRASSPLFCLIILLGIITGSISPILLIGNRNSIASCMTPWWLIGIGYAAIFSCLLAKNWRVWRIFDSIRLKTVAILDTDLLAKFVGALMLVELVILAFWTAFNPRTPHLIPGSNVAYNEVQSACKPNNGQPEIGIGIFLTFNVLMLFPIAFISYRTRVAKEEYRETSAIAIIVYSNIILTITFIGILFSTTFDYHTTFYLTGYGIWILLFVVYVALFLPKHYQIYFMSSASSTSSGVQLSTLQSQQAFDSGFVSRSAPTTRNNRDSLYNPSLVSVSASHSPPP